MFALREVCTCITSCMHAIQFCVEILSCYVFVDAGALNGEHNAKPQAMAWHCCVIYRVLHARVTPSSPRLSSTKGRPDPARITEWPVVVADAAWEEGCLVYWFSSALRAHDNPAELRYHYYVITLKDGMRPFLLGPGSPTPFTSFVSPPSASVLARSVTTGGGLT